MNMHNINLEALSASVAKCQSDPTVFQIPMNIEGEWRVNENEPQFGAKVKLPSGEEVLFESDFPPFLGGKGRKPSPLQYCFFGGMSCLASTLALTFARENISIRSMKFKTSGMIDFNQALGLSENPPIQNLTWEICVDADISDQDLARIAELAEKRCPASWMMNNIVPYKFKISKLR